MSFPRRTSSSWRLGCSGWLPLACWLLGLWFCSGLGGVWLLGGLLLWVRDDRAAAWLARQGDLLLIRVAAGRHRLREAARRTVAAWTMGAGVATAPPGALLIGGLGV